MQAKMCKYKPDNISYICGGSCVFGYLPHSAYNVYITGNGQAICRVKLSYKSRGEIRL